MPRAGSPPSPRAPVGRGCCALGAGRRPFASGPHAWSPDGRSWPRDQLGDGLGEAAADGLATGDADAGPLTLGATEALADADADADEDGATEELALGDALSTAGVGVAERRTLPNRLPGPTSSAPTKISANSPTIAITKIADARSSIWTACSDTDGAAATLGVAWPRRARALVAAAGPAAAAAAVTGTASSS